MALAYVPAQRVAANDALRLQDDDVIYWKRLQQVSVLQEPSMVTSVAMCPQKPYHIVATSSVRMSIYDPVVCEPLSQFSRFKQAVYGVRYRQDGELLVLGGDEGKVRVFSMDQKTGSGKAPLRSVRASHCALRVVAFSASGRTVFSMADDGHVKLWDIADTGSKALLDFSAHSDSIRAGLASSTNDHLVLTGGYDHTVKLWDSRVSGTDGAVIEMNASFPVESMQYLPNEHLVAVAAGPTVRIFDLTSGGRQLTCLQSHHKTVTSLSLAKHGQHLLSGAIDRRINVFNLADFTLKHSLSMASPVLGLAMSEDDQTLAVAMGNLLAIHKRAPAKKELVTTNLRDVRSNLRTAAPAVTIQEKGGAKIKMEISAKSQDQLRLGVIDGLLRSYQHALVIYKLFHPKLHYESGLVVSWLRVLVHRNVTKTALAGQESIVLQHLLKFLLKELFKNNNFEVLRHVVEAFFEVYGAAEVEPSVAVLCARLRAAMTRELSVIKQLSQSIGSLEMIFAATAQKQKIEDEDEDDIFGEPVISSIRSEHFTQKVEEVK